MRSPRYVTPSRRERLRWMRLLPTSATSGYGVVVVGPQPAFVNRHACAAREVARCSAAPFDRSWRQACYSHFRAGFAPRFDRADPIHSGLRSVRRDRSPRRNDRLIRVSRNVFLFEHNGLQVIAILANKPVAPAIERHAMLAAAGDRCDFERFRVEAKIAAAKFERLRMELPGRVSFAPLLLVCP